jgi:hypothetical protein
MRRISKHLSAIGCTVFRNNVGQAWTGNAKKITKNDVYYCERGDVIIKNARVFHGGLAKGSSDIIGWKTVEVTPEMVGKKLAVFMAVEVKKDERHALSAAISKTQHHQQQQRFVNAVKFNGGISGFAGSEEQAAEIVKTP